jgi:DNA mismatch endonuclease Vsr
MVIKVILFSVIYFLFCTYLLTIIALKKYSDNDIIVPRFNDANGFYTTKQRSELMGKIRSKNTKPEQKLRRELWKHGYRYRKNVKSLPGSPDIVFKKIKLVILSTENSGMDIIGKKKNPRSEQTVISGYQKLKGIYKGSAK